MLNIYLGEMEQAIYYPPAYFDNQYEDEWITAPSILGTLWILERVDLRLKSLIQAISSTIWKNL